MILAQLPRELAGADVDGVHFVRAVLQQAIGEAAGGRTETRVQMRGAAHVDRRGAKNLVMAGEVVEDTSGKSSLYVPPGTSKGFDPQPDPPSAREQ